MGDKRRIQTPPSFVCLSVCCTPLHLGRVPGQTMAMAKSVACCLWYRSRPRKMAIFSLLQKL